MPERALTARLGSPAQDSRVTGDFGLVSVDNPWVAEPPDDVLRIGEFARLSGLSIGALRHYDDVGLLVPASVDVSSS